MRPSWDKRRRLIHAILAFCAVQLSLVTVMMWAGLDVGMVALAQTIVLGAFGLAGSTIGSYIFGAAWDDKNSMKNLGPAAYKEETSASPKPVPEE